MNKADKFVTWYSKMEYEGGPSELARYGYVDSGNVKLNDLMSELAVLQTRIYDRVGELEEQYKEEINKLYES